MIRNNTRTVVISDVHIGSRYFLADDFLAFLSDLPQGVELVLNGDVIDDPDTPLTGKETEAAQAIRGESERRTVTWVQGNHDRQCNAGDFPSIRFVDMYTIGERLVIMHGDSFYRLFPHHWVFKFVFSALHQVRMLLGAEAVHVAFYAKRFPLLYRVLRRRQAHSATQFARTRGFEAVTCGHVHFAEDTSIDGIRYINTGSWTERPVYCLQVTDTKMELTDLSAR